MDLKKNGNFFSKYALTICKVIFACLAVSVIGIGILTMVHKSNARQQAKSASTENQKQQTASASTTSDADASETDTSSDGSSSDQGADPNVKDYVESSRKDPTEDSDSDDSSKNDGSDQDSSSKNDGSDQNDSSKNDGSDQDDSSDPDAAAQDDDSDKGTSTVSEKVQKLINSMTIDEKVAQLFLIAPEQLTGVACVIQAGDPTKQALADYPVGGLIYFENNIKTADQVKGMLANTKTYSEIPLFLGIDEEGGKVARIGNSDIDVPVFNDMLSIGQNGSATEARTVGTTIGGYLADLGFNLDFAPVADVVTDPENAPIGTRSFGGDPALVTDMTTAVAVGLKSQGVDACMKHFPGLGAGTSDTHSGLVSIDKTLAELYQSDLLPYESAIEQGVNFIMVGHGSYPNVTGDSTPASMSSVIITDLLRDQMGYNGIVITDALNMGAIKNNYSASEAALAVLNAGGDMLLMPADFEEAYQGLLSAVNQGTLTEKRIDESLARILTAKYGE